MRLVFESPGIDVLDMPDNICVSPRGGLVLCEDGGLGPSLVHGLTLDGRIFNFARNNALIPAGGPRRAGDFRGAEFCGATYSPNGEWLFVNIQDPGITFAITGPWEDGGL
jgi:secreted PhoX family phosphatase